MLNQQVFELKSALNIQKGIPGMQPSQMLESQSDQNQNEDITKIYK